MLIYIVYTALKILARIRQVRCGLVVIVHTNLHLDTLFFYQTAVRYADGERSST